MSDLRASGREQVADWIETSLLVRGTRQLGLDALHALAESEIGANAATVSLGVRAMARRASILGPDYPFHVMDVAVRSREGAETSPYAALLLMTPDSVGRQVLDPAPSAELVRLFERLVVVALVGMLGAGSRALRFGWPSEDGRPPEFALAIEWLANEMGIGTGSAYRPPRRRDGGVDVVGWRPFPDGRSGFPVLLVQCTLQQDILPKAGDIDVRFWSGWLTLDVEPMTVLAVPQTIPHGVVWDELAVRCLVLERVRLAGLVPTGQAVDGCVELVRDGVQRLAEVMKAAE